MIPEQTTKEIEQRALEKYPVIETYLGDINKDKRKAYVQGNIDMLNNL